MKLLISPIESSEIDPLIACGVDIIDLKSVEEGALGAPRIPVVQQVLRRLAGLTGIRTSLSLGDLPDAPGTAALAARGAASLGVDDIKAGLHGCAGVERARAALASIRGALTGLHHKPRVIAASYGDYAAFGGISPGELLSAAADTGCHGVMLDTWRKSGQSLFDRLSFPELEAFVNGARERELAVGLAGSIGFEHVPTLLRLMPDFVGVRGAVCAEGDRRRPIAAERVRRWADSVRECSPS